MILRPGFRHHPHASLIVIIALQDHSEPPPSGHPGAPPLSQDEKSHLTVFSPSSWLQRWKRLPGAMRCAGLYVVHLAKVLIL